MSNAIGRSRENYAKTIDYLLREYENSDCSPSTCEDAGYGAIPCDVETCEKARRRFAKLRDIAAHYDKSRSSFQTPVKNLVDTGLVTFHPGFGYTLSYRGGVDVMLEYYLTSPLSVDNRQLSFLTSRYADTMFSPIGLKALLARVFFKWLYVAPIDSFDEIGKLVGSARDAEAKTKLAGFISAVRDSKRRGKTLEGMRIAVSESCEDFFAQTEEEFMRVKSEGTHYLPLSREHVLLGRKETIQLSKLLRITPSFLVYVCSERVDYGMTPAWMMWSGAIRTPKKSPKKKGLDSALAAINMELRTFIWRLAMGFTVHDMSVYPGLANRKLLDKAGLAREKDRKDLLDLIYTRVFRDSTPPPK